MTRPGRGWAKFESLYSTFNKSDQDISQEDFGLTPHFESLGKLAAEALRAIDKVRAAHEATKRPSDAAEVLESALTFGQAADLVNAALPVLTELAGLIERKVQSDVEKARAKERRQQVEAEVTRIVNNAANQALNNLEPNVQSLRDEITGQTIGPEAVDDLEKARAIVTDLILQGESLLSTSEDSSSEMA